MAAFNIGKPRPCKGCTERYPACQDECPRLAENLALERAEKEARAKRMDVLIRTPRHFKSRGQP